MSSKKKMGRPKSKRRVNPQVEEQEKELSSHSHSQDNTKQESLVKKSSSSSRLTWSSTRKLGIGPLDPLPILKPFSETYGKKKKRLSSSTQREKSPQLKASGVSSSREARVLTRSSTKDKGKLIEHPTVENQSPSKEIHVTEFEVEVLKEVEVSTPTVVVKKKRKLVLPASSSSSSHHSASVLQEEVTSSRKPARRKQKDLPVYYDRTPHTHPKNKLRLNSKLIDNPKLKDLIINVEDSPPAKEEKKTIKKIRAKSMKQEKVKAKEVDALALLLAVLDSLKW